MKGRFETALLTGSATASTSSAGSEHAVTVGYLVHEDGEQAVVEVREVHDGRVVTRRFDASTIVHALLNLRPDEEFELEARYHP